MFSLYMKTLRHQFCVTKSVNVGSKNKYVLVQCNAILLDAHTLGVQTSLFKLTMRSKCHSTMAEPRDINPMTKLWKKVGQNGLMPSCLLEFFKLANIAISTVLSSAEDEPTFFDSQVHEV